MEKMLYAQLVLMNIFVLAVIWQSDVYKSRGPLMISQKAFRILLWLDIITMICDLIQVMYDTTAFAYSYFIENVTIFLYYVLHCTVAFVFALYADYELYPDTIRFMRKVKRLCLPIIINIGLSVSSFWNGFYFRINENNGYERGTLFYLPVLISCGYMLYILGIVMKYKREQNIVGDSMQKELYTRLFVFPLISCLGAILQTLMPGTAWIFPTSTLALLINYITVQNGYMARDHLTGLYNRGQLETFMNYQLENIKKGQFFFLILIDLDKFKEINDNYGHVVGDDALVNAAKLLRRNCKRRSDYVARLGGDEFVIIGQCEDLTTVDVIIERMHAVVDEFNEGGNRPYKLQFSAGYTIYDGNGYATLDTLISEADRKMYAIKKAKKNKEKN